MGKAHELHHASQAPNYSIAYPQARPWAFFRSAVHGLLAFLAAWLLAVAVSLLTQQHTNSEHVHLSHTTYVLVIDAGSSGTRMYAYNWTSPVPSTNSSLPIIKAFPPAAAAHLVPKKQKAGLYNRVETQPGLDAFADDLAGLSQHAVEPLLAWARAVVPAYQHADTPLYLLATGGLRRMQQHARDKLMHSVAELLQKSGFRFEESWATVISGTQEGVYGWLSLNYQLGLLQHLVQNPLQSASSGHSTAPVDATAAPEASSVLKNVPQSVGALDMGGSSLEMTFMVPLEGNDVSGTSWLQNVTLSDRVFHLHTHTFEHYGLNEAYDRAVTLLLEQQQNTLSQQQQRDADVAYSGAAGSAPVLQIPSTSVTHQLAAASSIASPSNISKIDLDAAAAHELQVDLAAAAAAGLKVAPGGADDRAGRDAGDTAARLHAGDISMEQADLLEQQRQADMATAAAAGLHITPPAESFDMNVKNSLEHATSSADDANSSATITDSALATAGSNTMSTYSSKALGISKAANDDLANAVYTQQASPMNLNSSDETAAADAQATAAMQGSSSSTSNSADDSISSGIGTQRGLHVSQHTVASGRFHQSAALSRLLFQQRRRQQRRHQRQLLLQQHHADMMQGLQGAFSDRAEELEELLAPSQTVHDYHGGQLQHGLDSADSCDDAAPQHDGGQQPQQQIKDSRASRHLLTRGFPSSGASLAQQEQQQHLVAQQSSNASTNSPRSDGLMKSAVMDDAHRNSNHKDTAAQHLVHSVDPVQLTDAAGAVSELSVICHPCLHDGYQAAYQRLALNGQQPEPAKVMLKGKPDWPACRQLVERVVNAAAPCDTTPQRPACRLGSAQPLLQGRFLALTGFYIVHKFLKLPPDAPQGAVLSAAQELCSRPWSWVQQHLGQQINAERYCTWGSYIVTLLRDGLKLTDDTVTISSTDVGWPLGAALAEGSKLPELMVREMRPTGAYKKKPQTTPSSQIGAAGSAVGVKLGLPSGPVAADGVRRSVDYSQRRSWAQRFWGSHKHLHMSHVFTVLVCVVAWLTFVVYCLPAKPLGSGHHVSAVLSGPWSVPVQYRLYGSPGLPVVANGFSRGRPSSSSSRTNAHWVST